MELNQIYTELVREHSMNSSNKHPLENKTDSQMGVNPSCGDELKLNVLIDDGIIKDASYEGIGCAISQASASMMIDVIKGKTLDEAKKDVQIFLRMIQGEDLSKDELIKIGDAAVFESISKLPMRVKCAVLAWRTLDKILDTK